MPLIAQRAEKLPPPVQDHLIHLLAQGLHVGIGKAGFQRVHAIGGLLSWAMVVGRASSSLKKCGSPMNPLSRARPDVAQPHRFPEFQQAPRQSVRDIWAVF